MAINKNALLRYKILDSCFSSGRTDYTFEKLLETVNRTLVKEGLFGISIRQLREDIKTMRELYKAPIESKTYSGKKCYYTYEDKDFSIFNSSIDEKEFNALRATIKMLGRHRSGDIWLEELLTSLECRFNIVPNSKKIIAFDNNRNLKGIEFLSPIIQCAVNGQAIAYTYRSFRGHEEEYTLHPYFIKQYNGSWFIFGWESKYGRYSNFALDRTVSIKPSKVQFVEEKRLDYEKYLKDVIGVTVPEGAEPPVTFRFRFTAERFPYVISKPLHHSQRVVDADNREIEINVNRNKELDQQVLSYIPDIEVISPKWYRKHIINIIEKNLKLYRRD